LLDVARLLTTVSMRDPCVGTVLVLVNQGSVYLTGGTKMFYSVW